MRHRTILLVLLALLFGGLLASGPAEAHAQYVSSTPAANAILPSPPTQVTVTLSENVQPGTGTIRVTNSTGAQFDVPPVNLSADGRTISVGLAPSGPCLYTVAWTAVSAVDGHFTTGSFSYAVENPDGSLCGPFPSGGPTSSGAPVSPFEVGLRFLGYFGVAVTLGIGVLADFMWLPAGRDPDARGSPAYGLGFPVLLNIGRIAAFAFAASMVGLFALATGLEGTSAADGLRSSPYVQSVTVRLVLAVGMFVLLSRAFAKSREGTPEGAAWTIQASIVLAVAAIVTGSLGTHAAAAQNLAALGVAADAAHLAGVGFWFGGLAGIVAVRRLLLPPEAASLARIVLGRFSRMAAYAVGLVLGGGLVLSLLLVGTWEALIGSAYGWVVLGKVALFSPMVGLGAFNRYRLLPKTVEAEASGDAVRRLVSNVRFETGLGIAVLVLAGLLTSMTPAATAVAQLSPNFVLESTSNGVRIHLDVIPYPTVPGVYTFTFLLYNATTGDPYDATGHRTNGTIKFTLTGSPAEPKENLSGPHPPNHFFITKLLSMPGIWRIDVIFSPVETLEALATFYVTIGAGG